MKVRCAVIGLGRIGSTLEADALREKPCTHTGAIIANPDCLLIAGADIDADARRQYLQDWGDAAAEPGSDELRTELIGERQGAGVVNEVGAAEAVAGAVDCGGGTVVLRAGADCLSGLGASEDRAVKEADVFMAGRQLPAEAGGGFDASRFATSGVTAGPRRLCVIGTPQLVRVL